MSRTIRRVFLIGLTSLVIYPLSYVPAHRLIDGPDPDYSGQDSLTVFLERWPDSRWAMIYYPVLGIIDRTWLSEPLLLWSDLWGVGFRHRTQSDMRNDDRNPTPTTSSRQFNLPSLEDLLRETPSSSQATEPSP